MRWHSRAVYMEEPLISIAVGADWSRAERNGHARGIIAIGDIATGVIAIGGIARGLFSLGGIAIGIIALGGISLGVFTVAGLALGAFGFGGVAIGQFLLSPVHRDARAVEFFQSVFRFIPRPLRLPFN